MQFANDIAMNDETREDLSKKIRELARGVKKQEALKLVE